ncbi:MAG: class II fructose-bisphosphate aldolase [Acidobacteriota bacterium]|nr:class II fructose-bisphosphate aldolase [Acidobacteriota bacterium]
MKKYLDISRIQQIKQQTGAFLTLHDGSGVNYEDFRKAVAAGINVIHINTELRVAWRRGWMRYWLRSRRKLSHTSFFHPL